MNTILGLIVLALDIIAIVDCAKSSKAMGKKILWIILVLILPIIGMVLYFWLGREKKAA